MSPLICDFGLTKNEEFDITSEATKNSRTARWMCPTVVNGDHQTEKTDIFSFGMTIAEILTGQHPFPLLSKFNVQLAFHRGQRPPPEPLPSNGKRFAPLWKLAALCWEQKPSDRPNAKDVESTLTSLEHTSKDPNNRICNYRDPTSHNITNSFKRRRSDSPESTSLADHSEGHCQSTSS
ncbi:hypothetical protein FRB94_007372 [Tulasnella sp. JGI-2019a]|nr:hypothetical protein FRB94_007372 [Tulasnella sp. JGI-2019a]